jgi:hypothetical protein
VLNAVYNPFTDRYWRIRHDQSTGDVVFETATDNGGAPGTWTLRYRERWDVTSVPVTAVIFELKAGTWQAESAAPGLVVFDNFKAARPGPRVRARGTYLLYASRDCHHFINLRGSLL